MSKYVKSLISDDLRGRLEGVDDALLVDVIGIDANATVRLRADLRSKGIKLMVIKNSMAKRATEGSALAPALDGAKGTLALLWGGEDFISLVKEASDLDKGSDYEKFAARGGVMDGQQLTPDRVREMSKWPNRQEQLSLLAGQIVGTGSKLSGQLLAPGGAVASQIEQKSEGEEDAE